MNPKQHILLSENGCLIKSCNTLFDTTILPPNKFLELFPLVESVFVYLLQLPLSKHRIFERVSSNPTFLSGFYDFEFFVTLDENNARQLNWIIEDKTSQYCQLHLVLQQDQGRIIDQERNFSYA